MAQRAETLNRAEPFETDAPVFASPDKARRSSHSHVLVNLKNAVFASCHDAGRQAARSCSSVVRRSQAMTGRLKRKLHNTREHKPLYIVAFAAGSAFVLGIALRVWKARRSG